MSSCGSNAGGKRGQSPFSEDEKGYSPRLPLPYFADMIDHCLDYASEAKKAGRPIVGILCEYTPREVILAAGGVPICLCGGDAAMIPCATTWWAR